MKFNLCLKFEEQKNEFLLENNINVLSDKKLIKTLSKPNIKNGNSSLIIKSMNNLPIYDVIQIKINMSQTGTFLVSFEKDKIDENIRENLLTEISKLKDNNVPTHETQKEKTKQLLNILSKFNPIYVTYEDNDNIILKEEDFNEICDQKQSFPLLILSKEKRMIEKKTTNRKHLSFELFNFDYFFISVFSFLLAFATTTGIYEILNGKGVAYFLLTLSVFFVGFVFYTVYSAAYNKKNQEINSSLKLYWWLSLYIVIGIAIGFGLGYIIDKFLLTKDVENIDYSLIFKIGIPVCVDSCFVALTFAPITAKIANLFKKLIKKN